MTFLAALAVAGPALASEEPGVKQPADGPNQPARIHETREIATPEIRLGSAEVPITAQAVELENEEVVGESDQPEESPWAGTVELYGFTPLRSSGTTTVNGRDADFDLDLGDILNALDGAFYVRGSVERDRWGFLTDLSYVKLGGEGAKTGPGGRLTGKARVSFDQGIYDFALRYRIGDRERAIAEPGSYTLLPYAGIRVLDIESQVDLQIQGNGPRQLSFERSGSFDRTWVQPLVGIKGSYFLSPRLRAFARFDIGGFGISGDDDLSGNAQLGLGYAIGNNTDLNLSWRYQGLRYDDGKNSNSGLSMDNNGIELGVKFFF
ncbi:MAG: hypothetical protein AB1Z21_09600 [Synechococcaceae cyanobacterium]